MNKKLTKLLLKLVLLWFSLFVMSMFFQVNIISSLVDLVYKIIMFFMLMLLAKRFYKVFSWVYD